MTQRHSWRKKHLHHPFQCTSFSLVLLSIIFISVHDCKTSFFIRKELKWFAEALSLNSPSLIQTTGYHPSFSKSSPFDSVSKKNVSNKFTTKQRFDFKQIHTSLCSTTANKRKLCRLNLSSSITSPSQSDEFSASSSLSAPTTNTNNKDTVTDTQLTKSKTKILASYKSIITFVSTTIIIWLSEPILSLVDTTVLGRFSSTSSSSLIQLAALGPATMLIDSAIYLTYFLGVATTNLIAKAIAQKDVRAQRQTTSHALGVAFSLGLLISISILFFGVDMLQWIIGGDGAATATTAATKMNENLLMRNEALQYVRIRCLTAPLSVMGIIAQSAALASLDTWTPFLAVILASLTNIVGDLALCVHPFQMGIKGAAIATAAASAVGGVTLLLATRKRMNRLQKIEDEMEKEETKNAKSTTIPFISFPDGASMLNLIKLAGPIFFVITGKIVCYSAMTLRATAFGVVPLACYNIMLRIYFFFLTFGDSFGQSAQTFLPQALYSSKDDNDGSDKDGEEKDKEIILNKDDVAQINGIPMGQTPTITTSPKTQANIKKNIHTFLSNMKHKMNRLVSTQTKRDKNPSSFSSIFYRHTILCVITAIITQQIAANILTTKSFLFTSEQTISDMMSKYTPWISISLLIHPFIMLFEGSIIASRDLGFLVKSYGAVLFMLLMRLKVCDSLVGVWKSLILMQSLRLMFFGSRVLKKMTGKKDKEEGFGKLQ